jgi:hypothetical protein
MLPCRWLCQSTLLAQKVLNSLNSLNTSLDRCISKNRPEHSAVWTLKVCRSEVRVSLLCWATKARSSDNVGQWGRIWAQATTAARKSLRSTLLPSTSYTPTSYLDAIDGNTPFVWKYKMF